MLREIAKFASGLVAADFLSALFFSGFGFFPLTIFGFTWPDTSIVPILGLDGALFLLLVHFGWGVRLPVASPSERALLTIAGIIFLVVGLLHLGRIAFGLDLALGSFDVPVWLSWFGVFITGYLSYACLHFARRMGSHH